MLSKVNYVRDNLYTKWKSDLDGYILRFRWKDTVFQQ